MRWRSLIFLMSCSVSLGIAQFSSSSLWHIELSNGLMLGTGESRAPFIFNSSFGKRFILDDLEASHQRLDAMVDVGWSNPGLRTAIEMTYQQFMGTLAALGTGFHGARWCLSGGGGYSVSMEPSDGGSFTLTGGLSLEPVKNFSMRARSVYFLRHKQTGLILGLGILF